MMSTPQQTITRILQNYDAGDQKAFDQLFNLLYENLHLIAKKRRRQWRGNNTLNTTAILHEAYLKLVDQSAVEWESRSHFYTVASKAMRHILINYARDQNRQKRGGDQQQVSLERLNLVSGAEVSFPDDRARTFLLLEKALKRLEKQNSRQGQIVEYRFFGGMTIKETAEALGVSPKTVKRGWNMAKLWLYREMQKELS